MSGLTELGVATQGAKAVGDIVTGIGEVGLGVGSLIQNKKAREEARDIANENRDMTLQQRATWQKLSDRQFANDEERFELEKKIVTDKNRFDLFFREIDKAKEVTMTMDESLDRLDQASKMDDNFKNVLFNLLKG
jgi:hypothetical protein